MTNFKYQQKFFRNQTINNEKTQMQNVRKETCVYLQRHVFLRRTYGLMQKFELFINPNSNTST